MLLLCPHCDRRGDHVRSDFIGDWVVCPVCELPFAWRDSLANGDGEDASEHEDKQSSKPATRGES